VRHTAATRIGQSVTITAEILEVKDGKIRFAVTATNDQGVRIGEGRHRRAVIDQKKFAGGASIAN
jgi:predicted thioesterase